jgi:CHAT domain-containing protein/Tfp pilus assembly protein PilF
MYPPSQAGVRDQGSGKKIPAFKYSFHCDFTRNSGIFNAQATTGSMKSIMLFSAGLLVCFASVAQSPKVPKVYEDLERHYEAQNFEACLKLEKDVEVLAKTQRDTIVANSFFYVGEAHHQLGSLDKAISWFEREKVLRSDLGLMQTDAFSSSLFNLAYLYLEAGNYEQAAVFADQVIDNDKKMYGVNSEEFAQSVISTVNIYGQLDRFADAEKLLVSTIRQQEKGSLREGVLLSKLGDVYTMTSQYPKASRTLQSALDIIEKKSDDNSPEFITAAINLGILYMAQGKYAEAEEAFDYALGEITPDAEAYPAIINNQATVYQQLGQLERAEKVFQELQAMDSVSIGTQHPDFAITLSNIGLVYSDLGKYDKAEKVIKQALEIQKANNESKSASYARKLNNLARVYRMSGKPEKAIPLHEQALALFKKQVGENSPEFATTSFNLGIANWQLGKKDIALKYLKSSASIRGARLGKKHPKYAESIQKIGEFEWEQKKLKEAKQSFGAVFESYYYQVESTFPVLTEEEKAKFYYNNIKPGFEKYYSFALDYQNIDPAIWGEVYDHQINSKAAIMYATEKVKQAIHDSKDTLLIREYENWQAQKELIAKLYSQNQRPEKIDSLQIIADRIEKELTRRSSVFAKQIARKRVTWVDIQNALKEDEAAMEVIRFNRYAPDASGKFKDEVNYALLFVTKKTKTQPDLVMLTNGNEMENKLLNYYRNNIKFTMEDTRSYKFLVEPITAYLAKNQIRKLFISPDGIYNQFNVNTIKNPTNGKFAIDEYDLRIVTNSRDILEKKTVKSNSQSSLLIGFPKFTMAENAEASGAVTRSVTRGGNLSRGLRGGLLRQLRGDAGIAVLPGTQIEINQIAKLSPNPEIFMEDMASEGLIKQVISPMVLHIATHGYFLNDEDFDQNTSGEKSTYVPSPLLKSGIILAGAEDFLKTGVPVNDEGDDGVLTAYEAMNLNLEDTELVVLSACETGLGVVKNGEGVYGLQRAFRMAGAKTLIMSLWQVDDAATQQLMSLFYSERPKFTDPHEAFRSAQMKLKEKFPHPFYWGAFIMVGI